MSSITKGLDSKEILISYIATLTNSECKDLYYLITERRRDHDWIKFGERVKITTEQYNKLMWLWGKDKLDCCIKILDEWLVSKEITKQISCYKSLIGWVETKYYTTHSMDDKSIKFSNKIDTKWKAKEYIKRIPKELRAHDSEVRYLVEKYGVDILKGCEDV